MQNNTSTRTRGIKRLTDRELEPRYLTVLGQFDEKSAKFFTGLMRKIAS